MAAVGNRLSSLQGALVVIMCLAIVIQIQWALNKMRHTPHLHVKCGDVEAMVRLPPPPVVVAGSGSVVAASSLVADRGMIVFFLTFSKRAGRPLWLPLNVILVGGIAWSMGRTNKNSVDKKCMRHWVF